MEMSSTYKTLPRNVVLPQMYVGTLERVLVVGMVGMVGMERRCSVRRLYTDYT